MSSSSGMLPSRATFGGAGSGTGGAGDASADAAATSTGMFEREAVIDELVGYISSALDDSFVTNARTEGMCSMTSGEIMSNWKTRRTQNTDFN